MSEHTRAITCALIRPRFRPITSLLLLTSACYLLPFVRILHRVGDEGTIVYNAQRVIDGAIPYRDFVEVMGPGSFYWLALFFKAFGSSWQTSRLCVLVTAVSTSLLVYWIARRYMSRTATLVPWLFLIVLDVPLWPACTHHWDSNLFALGAAACFIEWQKRQNTIWLAATGFLAGITSCFIQQKGLYLLAAFLVVLLVGRPKPAGRGALPKLILTLAAPYLAVGAAVLLLFYRAGALSDLVYCTIVWPFSAYHNVNAGICWKSIGVAMRPAALYFQLFPIYIALLFQAVCLLPFLIVIVSPLFVIGFLVTSRTRAALFGRSELALVLPALALWLAEIHRIDIYHSVYGSPLLIVAAVYLLAKLPANRVRKAALATITFALVTLAIGWLWDARTGYPIQTRRGMILDLDSDDALRFLNTDVAKKEWVFVYPYYPMYYYLADIRNPTRFSILIHNYNPPRDFDEVTRDLETKHVKFVLWDTLVDGTNLRTWFLGYTQPPAAEMKFEEYLNASYDLIAVKNGFRILRRKP